VIVFVGVLVTISTMAVDFAHARYVAELVSGRAHAAARWSAGQGAAATIGFVLAVKVSMWLVPFEILGLYLGTWLGAKRRRVEGVPPS
jgi:O-antigen/teichoic acid export membrane protein